MARKIVFFTERDKAENRNGKWIPEEILKKACIEPGSVVGPQQEFRINELLNAYTQSLKPANASDSME